MNARILFTATIFLYTSYLLLANNSDLKTNHSTDKRPAVMVWNYDHMLNVRKSLQNNENTYQLPYAKLIKEAKLILDEKAVAVTDKPDYKIARSGDKHDFISVSKYAWPNPDTEDGFPWVYVDGIINEENFSKDDAVRLDKMTSRVSKLCLAYFFSGDNRFAEKAVELSRVWFIDPSSRMNPNLTYAQVIPGVDKDMGHPPGIIFGRNFIYVLAGLSLLQESPAYTSDFQIKIKNWFSEYFIWLTTSEAGDIVDKMPNNHSIAYDEQLLAIALFTGDTISAKKIVSDFFPRRIAMQVEPDGRMPHELSRNRALGYSAFNIKNILEFCEMARDLNPNLFFEKTVDNKCIGKSIDFIAAYPGKTVADFSPYQQIADWEKSVEEVCWILKWAHNFNNSSNYLSKFKEHIISEEGNINFMLY